ncbi:MAG: cell division protein FtsL [Pseudomonadota bacterium]|nr:MAG: cell division protein FtsL [Pseudomonadota bacterium]
MRWLAALLLLAAVLASAVAVIVLRHESRLLFVALQEAEQQRDAARVEWSRLQLEQAWLAEAGRVEREAREALDMRVPEQIRLLVEAP